MNSAALAVKTGYDNDNENENENDTDGVTNEECELEERTESITGGFSSSTTHD